MAQGKLIFGSVGWLCQVFCVFLGWLWIQNIFAHSRLKKSWYIVVIAADSHMCTWWKGLPFLGMMFAWLFSEWPNFGLNLLMIPAWAVGITTAPCVCFPSGELAQSLIFDLWRGRKVYICGIRQNIYSWCKECICQILPTFANYSLMFTW